MEPTNVATRAGEICSPLGFRFTVVIMCLLLMCGCRPETGGEPESLWPEPSTPTQREIVTADWDTLLHLGGSAEDTMLIYPLRIAATVNGLAVFDVATEQVDYFSLDGRHRWSFGRKGSGPDEFQGARDLKVDGNDRIHVLDPQNLRITVLDTLGQVIRRVPLASVGHAEKMVVLRDGRTILFTLNPEQPLAVIDSTGKLLERLSIPWTGFARLNALQSQGMLNFDPGTDRWVFTFTVGNGWFAYEGTEPRLTGAFVEHVPFPGILTSRQGEEQQQRLTRPIMAALSAGVRDSLLYVHFGGRTRMSRFAIDVYRLEDGDYIGSYRLPRRASYITVADDRIYILANNPYPEILALRPR